MFSVFDTPLFFQMGAIFKRLWIHYSEGSLLQKCGRYSEGSIIQVLLFRIDKTGAFFRKAIFRRVFTPKDFDSEESLLRRVIEVSLFRIEHKDQYPNLKGHYSELITSVH